MSEYKGAYMVRIMNMRNNIMMSGVEHFRVDRNSVLGNPFHMKDESERDSVCEQYSDYLYAKVKQADKAIIEELERIKLMHAGCGIVWLWCWCAPLRCHAETIRDYVLSEGRFANDGA